MATTMFGDAAKEPQKPTTTMFGDTASQPVPTPPEVEKTGRNREQFLEGSAVREIGEGVVSGALGAVEGVVGLGALAVDLVADTDYGDKVTQAAEATRDALGLDPEGILGKGAEIITQFVVPGGIAAKAAKGVTMAGRAAKGLSKTPLTKAERFTLASKEIAAAGIADAAVSTDDNATIGDWVDMGPTQTTDLVGIYGREKALARLGNRLKIGVEATGIGGVAQAGLGLAGKTIGDAKVTKNIAQATNKKIDDATQSIDNLLDRRLFAKPGSAEELGKFKSFAADAIAFSRYRGYLPGQISEKRLLMDGQVQTQIKRADRILKDLDTELDDFVKKLPEESNLNKVGIMNRVESYLTETDEVVKKRVLKELPKGVRQNAMRMRAHVNRLSKDVLDSNFLKEAKYTKDGKNVNDMIEKNINAYLRRRYKIFEDSKYVPTEKSIKVADDYFTRNRKSTAKELTEAARKDTDNVFNDDFLKKNGLTKVGAGRDFKIEIGNKVTPQLARLARENFLGRYSIESRKVRGGGRVATDRLETGMFQTRKNISPELRSLLGEVKDPREAYLGTIADLAQFTAVDDYFGTVASLARQDSGIGKFFIDGKNLTREQQAGLETRGFVKLGEDGRSSGVGKIDTQGEIVKSDGVQDIVGAGSSWGELEGFYVPDGVYKNLSNQILAEDSLGGKAANAIVGTLLKGKGISQYSKTVLSPITQVRNFTTATAFATANGNVPIIGRGGSLKDSFKAIHANIANKGDKALFNDLADAQRRGVMGTNAELREIQDTLNKGLDLYGKEPKNFIEATFGEAASKSGAAKGAKFMEDLYQGSDDYWKYYSYNAEQAKIRNMLKDATPEQQMSYLLKTPTPNLKKLDGPEGLLGNSDYLDAYKNLTKAERVDPRVLKNLGMKMPDNQIIDELIKNRAAQIVRDTVPNYNKGASDLIKLGRKLPVGNFITFPAEMMRTGFNIVKQGLDDMASDIPAVQARGRQRLAGFATTTVVVPAAVLETAYAVTGVSREEMEAYKRSFGAPWEKGSVLVPTGRTEDGKIKYINFSTSNPYDVLSRFANRAINEADEAIKEGKDPGQAFSGIVGNTVKEFLEPFMSEAILTEAIIDISFRNGRTSTGAEVYNPQDSVGTKGIKMMLHLADTIMPGFVPANITSGGVEPSRLLRGVLGTEDGPISYKDKMGRERTFVGEMARSMTGVTPLEFDPKKGLEYGGFRMQRAQTDSKRMFNKVVDDENADSDTLFNAFVDANEAKLRVDRQYYQMVEDLRTMGMKDSEIRRVFKREGIGGVKGIMRGEFEPFKMSDKNRKDMQKAGIYDQYPRAKINELRKQMKRMPLAPDDGPSQARNPRPIPVKPSTTIFGDPSSSLSPPAPIVPTGPRPALGPPTTTMFGDSSLIGGDPATQEIANRLGRG